MKRNSDGTEITMDNKKNKQRFPAVTTIRSRRFNINSETDAFLDHLDTHGYAVIANVASSSDVEHAKDLFWDFLEGKDHDKDHAAPAYQVRRDDPSTWEVSQGWLGSTATGIISTAGVGQAPFMWYLRLLPDVRKTFASIWKTEEDKLLCSFDGANVFRPWKYNPTRWRTNGGWFHLDQNAYNPGKAGRCCVQGLITLTKADEHSGGLTVIPGSHKDFLDVCERNAEKPKNLSKNTVMLRSSEEASSAPLMDFVRVGNNDEIRSKGGRLICAEPGDMIVWDSRTVHCNSPALTDDSTSGADRHTNEEHPQDQDQWELLRMAAYICMTPASWAKKDDLHKRWDAYVNNMSTTHWPHHYLGGTRAPFDMSRNDPSNLSQIQRQLIGGTTEPPASLLEKMEYIADQIEARKILELAEEAEGNGDCSGAIRLYRQAYKLDPTLEFPDGE